MKIKLICVAVMLAALLGLAAYRAEAPYGNIKPSPAILTLQNSRTVTPFLGFVRGGIHSVEEFKAALNHDSALATQFVGFDFASARLERLTKAECVYIAYRRRNTFAWTKSCKLLPAGTLILTDGHYRIRAACGNLISNTPEVPTIPAGDEPTTLDPNDPVLNSSTTVPDSGTIYPQSYPMAPTDSSVSSPPPPPNPMPVGSTRVPDGDGGYSVLIIAVVAIGAVLAWEWV